MKVEDIENQGENTLIFFEGSDTDKLIFSTLAYYGLPIGELLA
jgi:hypothetical protein